MKTETLKKAIEGYDSQKGPLRALGLKAEETAIITALKSFYFREDISLEGNLTYSQCAQLFVLLVRVTPAEGVSASIKTADALLAELLKCDDKSAKETRGIARQYWFERAPETVTDTNIKRILAAVNPSNIINGMLSTKVPTYRTDPLKAEGTEITLESLGLSATAVASAAAGAGAGSHDSGESTTTAAPGVGARFLKFFAKKEEPLAEGRPAASAAAPTTAPVAYSGAGAAPAATDETDMLSQLKAFFKGF